MSEQTAFGGGEWYRQFGELWAHLWAWSHISDSGDRGIGAWSLYRLFRSEFEFFFTAERAERSRLEFYRMLEALAAESWGWDVAAKRSRQNNPIYVATISFDPAHDIVERMRDRGRFRSVIFATIDHLAQQGSAPTTDEVMAHLEVTEPELLRRIIRSRDLGRVRGSAFTQLQRQHLIAPVEGQRGGRRWRIVSRENAAGWFVRDWAVAELAVLPSIESAVVRIDRVVAQILREHPDGLHTADIFPILQERLRKQGIAFGGHERATLLMKAPLTALRERGEIDIYPPSADEGVTTGRPKRWFHRVHLPLKEEEYEARVLQVQELIRQLLRDVAPQAMLLETIRGRLRERHRSVLESLIPKKGEPDTEKFFIGLYRRAVYRMVRNGELLTTGTRDDVRYRINPNYLTTE